MKASDDTILCGTSGFADCSPLASWSFHGCEDSFVAPLPRLVCVYTHIYKLKHSLSSDVSFRIVALRAHRGVQHGITALIALHGTAEHHPDESARHVSVGALAVGCTEAHAESRRPYGRGTSECYRVPHSSTLPPAWVCPSLKIYIIQSIQYS
jgi:hypothetical protein